MSAPKTTDPGNGDELSSNGAIQQLLSRLCDAIATRSATGLAEARKLARTLTLSVFIQLATSTKLSWRRQPCDVKRGAIRVSRLRTLARHCPGFSRIAIADLRAEDVRRMCDELAAALAPAANRHWRDRCYHGCSESLSNLLGFLFFPPLRLLTRAEVSGLVAAIWSAGRSYPPTRPWPASGQEAAGPESITGEVAPDELGRGLALQLLLFTGLRRDEAGCLQQEELDPAGKQLHLAKKPRGRTPTVVEIPEALRLAFEAWLKSNRN